MSLKSQAVQEYFWSHDALSDMDSAYNPETKEFDIPSAEWDGIYGKHWVKYVSEEARDKALKSYQCDMNKWVANRMKEIKVEKIKEQEEMALKRMQSKACDNTFGNLFPELVLCK